MRRKLGQLFSLLRQERGAAEAIEYMAMVPWVIFAALIGIQLLVGVQTVLVANSAAREGARAASVCESYGEAIRFAAPGFNPSYSCSVSGNRATCRVTLNITSFIRGFSMPVSVSATMRYEGCHK